MQVKRFFAADMRIAMKMVRDELGADAVIIGNRRVAGGVELTAVLDYPMQSAPAATKPNPALEAELRKTQARLASAHADLSSAPRANMQDRQLVDEKPAAAAIKPQAQPVAAAATADARAIEAMQSELHGLRELIEVQLGSIAWGRSRAAVRSRPAFGAVCSAWGCPPNCRVAFWRRSQASASPARLGVWSWRTWRRRSRSRRTSRWKRAV